ncbi:MAG: 5-formyltetrahydrofolate cyclo-ligase [Clostridia bacterium]|nr:5-formyltetrahydrofolate cyclo-ligase [Clostridia bacterium]
MVNKARYAEIRTRKNEIRAQYREKRAALTADIRHEYDEKICALFLSSITYRFAKALLLYAPLEGEIDCMPIARRALEDGKLVAFPRCGSEEGRMDYHVVSSLDELESGTYGILEPSSDAPVCDFSAQGNLMHPVCIVPGLVFDTDGYRVGYGKGYYDRYLASFTGVRVGLVYTDFLLPQIPRGRYDLAVDILVTEKGVRAVHAN